MENKDIYETPEIEIENLKNDIVTVSNDSEWDEDIGEVIPGVFD